jgi:hypothetical protein
MEKNILKNSNQFPIEQKNTKYKHDFVIKDGFVIFEYFGHVKRFTGFNFITWLNDNFFKDYFEYIVYHWYGFNIIIVPINKNDKMITKNTNTGDIEYLDKFPDILNPKIVGVKPKIDNVIHHLQEEIIRREEEKRNYEENTIKDIKKDLIKNNHLPEEIDESKVLRYDNYIKENWLKKAALVGALAGALSSNAQQKIDTFSEFKQNENINKDFKSFEDINIWLKQNFEGSVKWDINHISIKEENNLLKINIDRKISNTGYNKIILAVNKEGNTTESKDNILSKNPNSKEINSGEINFKDKSYDWFLHPKALDKAYTK